MQRILRELVSGRRGGRSERSLDEIHAAFPDKPIVISEYGYCACTRGAAGRG